MKKLMFAAAALASVTAFAAIESDVVGYGESALQAKFKLLTPMFMPVDGSDIKLSDLKLLGTADDDGSIQIQLLNSSGYASEIYTWWGDGLWLDQSDNEVQDSVSFKHGQGLWVHGKDANTQIQTSGKVATSDFELSIRNQFICLGNPYATDLPLGNILPKTTGTEDLADGSIQIQILSASGYADEIYTWWGDGLWLDQNNVECQETVTFKPGEGLYIHGSKDVGQTFYFAAPVL